MMIILGLQRGKLRFSYVRGLSKATQPPGASLETPPLRWLPGPMCALGFRVLKGVVVSGS